MNSLFSTIQSLVSKERYLVGLHASERMEERGILEWQVVSGLSDGELQVERINDRPHPCIEVIETLPDGTEVKAVWSLLVRSQYAKLVTVHYLDEE